MAEERPTMPEPRGAVLDGRAAQRALRVRRLAPDPSLAPFVRHYWLIDWDLGAPHTQSVLPVPAANLVFEADVLVLSGVQTRRFDRTLDGRGSVVGVLFEPGGLYAFWPRPMIALRDVTEDASARLGLVATDAHEALRTADDDEARARWLDDCLRALHPAPYDAMDEVNGWMALAAERAELLRADAWAKAAGCSLRTLQRRLRRYVGVSPKAVLRRHRLQEAAARLAAGARIDQAQLALSLGYFDQAHFVRDFHDAVGVPPAAYGARQEERSGG
ncbi:MAG: helix-turn-helix domain-containing protein [Myxococcales bacterium]|nr:helix-turn-helix domain-containing protein [Myxococcales bacterium]